MTYRRISLWALMWMAFSMVGCDAATKWMAANHLRGKHPIVVNAMFDFRYVENHDVAFHMMRWVPDSLRFYVILALGLFTSTVLLLVFLFYARRHRWLSVGFVCILSGAAGNILDRLSRGFVVDFIHVHYNQHSFPVFNVADICVSVGIGIIALFILNAPPDPPPHLAELPAHMPPRDPGAR